MLRTAEYSPMTRIQEQGDTCVMILDCDGVATVIDCQGPHFVTFYTLAFQPSEYQHWQHSQEFLHSS